MYSSRPSLGTVYSAVREHDGYNGHQSPGSADSGLHQSSKGKGKAVDYNAGFYGPSGGNDTSVKSVSTHPRASLTRSTLASAAPNLVASYPSTLVFDSSQHVQQLSRTSQSSFDLSDKFIQVAHTLRNATRQFDTAAAPQHLNSISRSFSESESPGVTFPSPSRVDSLPNRFSASSPRVDCTPVSKDGRSQHSEHPDAGTTGLTSGDDSINADPHDEPLDDWVPTPTVSRYFQHQEFLQEDSEVDDDNVDNELAVYYSSDPELPQQSSDDDDDD